MTLNDLTEEVCRAAIRATKLHPERFQGFHYGNEYIVRDMAKAPGKQRVWSGPDTDMLALVDACEVRRMRDVLAAAIFEAAKPAVAEAAE